MQQQMQMQMQTQQQHMTTTTTTMPQQSFAAVTSESSFASSSTAAACNVDCSSSNALFSPQHQGHPQPTAASSVSIASVSSSPAIIGGGGGIRHQAMPPASLGGTLLLRQQQQQQRDHQQQLRQHHQLQLQQPIVQPIVALPTAAGNDPSSTILAIPPLLPVSGMMMMGMGMGGGAFDPSLGMGGGGGGSSVPEFLYQLTKMLTDRTNRDIIEWSTGHSHGGPSHNNNNGVGGAGGGCGHIEVHHPARLEREVLARYFRHSKYSSFQRQLNYFGFRKVAGKGKMSPCSYVNDSIRSGDVRCLLAMRRKKGAREGGKAGSGALGAEGGGGSLDGDDDAEGGTAADGRGNGNGSGGRKRRLDDVAGRNDDVDGRAFDDMAASVAMNIATGGGAGSSSSPTTTTAASGMCPRAGGGGGIGDPPVPTDGSANGSTTTTTTLMNPLSSSSLSTITTSSSAASSSKAGVGVGAVGGGACRRAYNVAVGKGVRHQLNGYLRPRFVEPVDSNVAPSPPSSSSSSSLGSSYNACAPTPASSTTIASIAPSSVSLRPVHGGNGAGDLSYLSHPSARHASSAPAQLFRFLDPYELGMSPGDIECSLSQLKDNFALAAAASSSSSEGAAATDVDGGVGNFEDRSARGGGCGLNGAAGPSVAPSSSPKFNDVPSMPSSAFSRTSSSWGVDCVGNVKSEVVPMYAPSALTRRVAGGMLRPNDSLIDLAMLPVLDNAASEGPGGNNDYATSAFSRDDSLVSFLAASYGSVAEGGDSTTPTAGRTITVDDGGGGGGWSVGMGIGGDGNVNTFGFIDFQS